MTDSEDVRAREIIDGIIEYDAWRDNLHPNDFSWTKGAIAQALREARSQAFEEAAKIFDKKADEMLELLKNADTATAVRVFEMERNNWLRIAKAIRESGRAGRV